MRSTWFRSRSVVVALVAALLCAPLASTSFGQAKPLNNQLARPRGPLTLAKIKTTASRDGVLVEWRTAFEIDNIGFNVYRERNGRREQINPVIIAGSVLIAGQGTPLNGGYSYSWFDPDGTLDCKYSVEDLNLNGQSTVHDAGAPEWSEISLAPHQSKLLSEAAGPGAAAQSGGAGAASPQALAGAPVTTESSLTDQWAIAALPALKIGVRTNGWYHITQAQMAAADFNTTADAANLRLFVNAAEVAIRVSRSSGALVSGDYVEFWGQGLDTTSTDTQMYWLVNGTQAGKRIAPVTELKPDATPTPPPLPSPQPIASPAPSAPADTFAPRWLSTQGFFPQVPGDISYKSQPPAAGENHSTSTVSAVSENQLPGGDELAINSTPARVNERSSNSKVETRNSNPTSSNAKLESPNSKLTSPAVVPASKRRAAGNAKLRTRNSKLKRSRRRHKTRLQRPRHNHALMPAVTAAPAFLYPVERRDRTIYVASVLNGDTENFYGDVLVPIGPDPRCSHSLPAQTMTVTNLESTALVPAQLEVAIQGIGQTDHQLRVSLNGVQLGIMSFFGFDRAVQTFTVPLSSLLAGTNSVQVVPVVGCPGGSDLSLVDYTRITYPHSLTAESNSLQFSARSTQSPRVEGFTVPNIRVLDLTDLAAVQEIRPIVESSGAGYAATVPAGGPGKARTLVALPDNQFPQPASVTLNQPATLNANPNAGSLLVIGYKDFLPSLTAPVAPTNVSFVAQRQAQGYSVKLVDVEDVYDEFSYGRHDPQALKDFILWTTTHWATPPHDVIFLGGACYDPRIHEPKNLPASHADFVPTKLVDATYNETASDDWFVDFNDDGFAELGVGRLPARTVAAANLMVSKIVNYAPANVPQSALLVSDDPGTPPSWDFETSNDTVQGIIQPAGIGAQKVYRRLTIKVLTGTIDTNSNSTAVTGTNTLFLTELSSGKTLSKPTGELVGTISFISSNTSLTLTGNAGSTYSGTYGKQDDATAHKNVVDAFNAGQAVVNYSGHGQIDVWTGASPPMLHSNDATALNNGNRLSFVVVMDCLNGFFQDPNLLSLSEALLLAPNGGAVSAFASSGLTTTFGQRQMEVKLYHTLYDGAPMALGDAIKIAKADSQDIDVRRTWIYFGDPTLKIR